MNFPFRTDTCWHTNPVRPGWERPRREGLADSSRSVREGRARSVAGKGPCPRSAGVRETQPLRCDRVRRDRQRAKAPKHSTGRRLRHRRRCACQCTNPEPMARIGNVHAPARKLRGDRALPDGYDRTALAGSPKRDRRSSEWRQFSARVSNLTPKPTARASGKMKSASCPDCWRFSRAIARPAV